MATEEHLLDAITRLADIKKEEFEPEQPQTENPFMDTPQTEIRLRLIETENPIRESRHK